MTRIRIALPMIAALLFLSPGTAHAIYGGEEPTEPYSFAASMQFKTSQGVRHWCGGSLIAPQWVVIAKHCLLYLPENGTPLPKPSDVQVRVGSLDRTAGGELRDVTEFVVYGKPLSPDPLEPGEPGNDIALLKLASPVSAQPVELGETPAAGADVRLLGWGFNCQHPRGYGCGELPIKLRQLDTKTLPREGCISDVPRDRDIVEREICQAATAKGENARSHDSGSPMLVRAGTGWQLVGATSGPVEQGTDALGEGPNVYTDVTAYRSWIAEHIN